MTENLSIQDIVKQVRYKLGMSQEEFAHYIGVSAKSIYRWETTNKQPRPLILYRIMEIARENKFYSIRNLIAPTIDRYRNRCKCTAIDIITCRFSRRMSQAEFAEEIGVSLKTVQRWEKGRTKVSQFYVNKIKEFMQKFPRHPLDLLRFDVS